MPHPTGEDSDERLQVRTPRSERAQESFADDVRRGLTSPRKFLLPKYFYDELGSHLFEAICLLPEYYLTRAEADIFARRAGEIVEAAASGGGRVTLAEMGSGSATKTRLIINALLERQERLLYLPVDISGAALEQSSRELLREYPALSVSAYAADYEAALPRLPENFEAGGRVLVLFLGSNIGNFDREGALDFLRKIRRVLREGDRLLVGADLRKSAAVLEAAYDDALGVTAAFNLNLLARINRELHADFDIRAFRHVALYDERRGRVEMHVESLRPQTVTLRALALGVDFRAGERIHTENSYKYDLAELAALAAESGFRLERTWLDSREQFSSNLFTAEGEGEKL